MARFWRVYLAMTGVALVATFALAAPQAGRDRGAGPGLSRQRAGDGVLLPGPPRRLPRRERPQSLPLAAGLAAGCPPIHWSPPASLPP
ncbi:MAG: hypothetical protein R3D25_23020 [Geminicoccaceae bacterium]